MNDCCLIFDKYDYLFFDFDGVIKDSLLAKANAFQQLIPNANNDLRRRIANHHVNNAGISRFEKIPLYLNWAGVSVGDGELQLWFDKFGDLVFERVVQSEFVPGVLTFLKKFEKKQLFLLTATPTLEIQKILHSIKLSSQFEKVFGAPINKVEVVRSICAQYKIKTSSAVFFGDSHSDFKAAADNQIDFFLRLTAFNSDLALYCDTKHCFKTFEELL